MSTINDNGLTDEEQIARDKRQEEESQRTEVIKQGDTEAVVNYTDRSVIAYRKASPRTGSRAFNYR